MNVGVIFWLKQWKILEILQGKQSQLNCHCLFKISMLTRARLYARFNVLVELTDFFRLRLMQVLVVWIDNHLLILKKT